MDETLLQFGRPGGSGPRASATEERRAATVCPKCSQHFSPDGRFCPFDGEALHPAEHWVASVDPLLGTVVDGRYEICSLLGEGGMGVVYEARHRTLGKRFALKALRKELASDADIAARFMQEARTAASVSHPGLVEITDFGRLPTGQPFFVMALLEGQSLAALIRRAGPISKARAIDIVRQIADALGAAHEQSIVHRDLKPDNIHVSSAAAGPERVTIVDFGLAKVIGGSRMTRAGMVFGTPHYMSPEQAMGEATDHRADVYALGIVMYEMFTGRVPFEADSYMGVLTKHMYMLPKPPSQLVGTAELGVLEDIMLRCLEKKPEHRYASLRELTHDLDLALNAPDGERPSASRQRRAVPRSLLADELGLPSSDDAPSFRDPAAYKRRFEWPLIVIGALFLAGIAGVLAVRKATLPAAAISRSSAAPSSSAAARPRPPALAQMTKPASASAALVIAPLPIVSSTVPVTPVPAATQALGSSVLNAPALEKPATSPLPPLKPAANVRPPGKPASSAPQTAAAARMQSAPAKKPGSPNPGASEIVDPWAK